MNSSEVYSVLSEEKLNTWISYYSKRNSIEVKIDNSLEAAADIDLKDIDKPIIYFNPQLIKEKLNLSEEEVYFLLFREVERFKEELEILSTLKGQQISTIKKRKFKKLEKNPIRHKSMDLLESNFREIYTSNAVVSLDNIPALRDTRYSLYKNSLFKDTDYLNSPVYDQDGNIVEYRTLPKHLQFIYAVLREAMIADEECIIDPKIRKIIKRLHLNKSIELSTEGRLEDRLQNLWNRIEPIYKKLLDEDLKDIENKSNKDSDEDEYIEHSFEESQDEGEKQEDNQEDSQDNDGESPDYNRQYDTPEGGSFESNNTGKGGHKIEITPPMKGYFTTDNKSHFNTNTKKWNNTAKITKYDSLNIKFKGKKHTLSTKFSGGGLKSIPLPRGYMIDLDSLKFTGDKPEFFRDENGAFFLGINGKVEFSVDFYEEENIQQLNPIGKDREKLYNGNLTKKAQEALFKAGNETDFSKKVKIILDYIISNHFYPPGKNSSEIMKNAEKLQAKLIKVSKDGSEYIKNLDASKHLECYSANTLFIAMLREIGIDSKLVTGHHLQGEINKNGNSEINSSNGHAWSLVWDGKNWIGFDATPAKDSSDPRNKKDEDASGEENKNIQQDEANDGVEKNDNPSEGEQGQDNGDNKDSGDGEGQKSEGGGKKEQKNSESAGEKEQDEANDGVEKSDNLDNGQENNSPKNPFEDYYKDIKEIPHVLEDAIGKEELDKIKQKIAEAKVAKDKPKSKEDLELEHRVRNMGIDDKDPNFDKIKQNLKKYRDFLKQLENLKDSQTGESVMDEIENMFKLIRSKRLKPEYKSRGPVDIERGVRLDPSAIAQGIAAIKSGNLNPEMFLEDYKEEKERDFVGRFDLTIIADGSGSMEGEKNRQQKIATLAILEAIKRLHDRLDDEKKDLKSDISFNTEGFIFGANSRKIKDISSDLLDKERLYLYKSLDEDDGLDNNEGLLLANIYDKFILSDLDYLNDIRDGKVKKIIIVMTDGEQDVLEYEKKLLSSIKNFREQGVLVYGIGITSEGKSVERVYAGTDEKLGFGKVCKKPEDLATTLKDLLKEHLDKI